MTKYIYKKSSISYRYFQFIHNSSFSKLNKRLFLNYQIVLNFKKFFSDILIVLSLVQKNTKAEEDIENK